MAFAWWLNFSLLYRSSRCLVLRRQYNKIHTTTNRVFFKQEEIQSVFGQWTQMNELDRDIVFSFVTSWRRFRLFSNKILELTYDRESIAFVSVLHSRAISQITQCESKPVRMTHPVIYHEYSRRIDSIPNVGNVVIIFFFKKDTVSAYYETKMRNSRSEWIESCASIISFEVSLGFVWYHSIARVR